jgi:hypothetical protein
LLLEGNDGRLSTPEKKRLDERPSSVSMSSMFGKDICWIGATRDMEELEDLGSDGFADTVIG